MKHNFFCRHICTLPDNVIEKFVDYVTTLDYFASSSFPDDIIQVYAPIKSDLLESLLLFLNNWLRSDGHFNSNIARMSPYTYMPEHTDILKNRIPEHYGPTNLIKLQIPIITNPQVLMMWYDRVNARSHVCHFVKGGVYVINNIVMHSVANGGPDHRYFITMRYKYPESIRQTELFEH
jgi:hypothetical protein